MTVARLDASATLLGESHHDGSELYVVDRPEEPGGEAVVRLRAAHGVDAVAIRWVADGEPRALAAEPDGDGWWTARFPVTNPLTPYRWLLSGGEAGYAWLNGLGVVDHDVPDGDDFVLALDRGGPSWQLESVVYEIFPDRFASSGLDVERPEWAVRRAWDELPEGRGPNTPREWYGGDLRGIEQRLDHVESLGANVLYLTPIFPAGSTHRYDSTSFDRVDPLLGGDAALESLVAAAHGRGIRVLGDLTTNHTGVGHDWFVAGERELYLFDEAGDYESWMGFKGLPKLNWRSPELRERMQQVARKWLEAPFELDGWRVDVANMSGRYRDRDDNDVVARTIRAALKDDDVLVAEHGHDYRPDIAGWHGVMNYAGFLRPAWCWLRGDVDLPFLGLPASVPRLGGGQAVATMRAFRAGVPWQSVLHSWTLLDSHDTGRFRTVAGSPDRHVVGIGLQMTTPGVPMMFAGDELGLEGEWGEDARRTMPWDRSDEWDDRLLDEYRRLIALRRSQPALARGGIRYAYVGDDAIAYLRETHDERLLCLAVRAQHEPIRLPFRSLETLYGDDAELAGGEAVLPADGPSFHVWRITDG